MIKTTGLTKSFGNNIAVAGVTLHVAKQDIFGLVGPDGAGKTTLMRMICGLITPNEGQVSLIGYPWEQIERVKKHLGYMPQRFSLYGDLTIMENIHFFGSMYQIKRQTINERAKEILELTNLLEFKDRLADNLSGGMKQKLALTCALITRPSILVLDEPTYGVDPESRKEFWKILYQLNKEGITILVSTPYMDEAELCTTVAFINQGKIVAVDSPTNLKNGFPYSLLEIKTESKDPDLFNGLSLVIESSFYGDNYHLAVENVTVAEKVIKSYLISQNLTNIKITKISPTMEDVFVSLAEKEVV